MPTEGKIGWEEAKRCLIEIHQSSREFLYRALLIGGAATWFYRRQLLRANDADFNIQASNPTDENVWVSRDIDFTGVLQEDAFLLLPSKVVSDDKEDKHIEVQGVRLGFSQVGVTGFDPEEVFGYANVGVITFENQTVEFLVLDPLSLYYEKSKLCAQRGYANDHQHKALLYEYIAFQLVHGAERVLRREASVQEARKALILWQRVASRACELLQDKRVRRRLEPLVKQHPKHEISQHLASFEAA